MVDRNSDEYLEYMFKQVANEEGLIDKPLVSNALGDCFRICTADELALAMDKLEIKSNF